MPGTLGFEALSGEVPSARAGDGWEGAALFVGVMKDEETKVAGIVHSKFPKTKKP